MTAETLPKEVADNFKAEYIVPLVAYLASDQCEENGSMFEVAGGYISKHRI
jgi:multifunctional beta-oxidation protein